MKQLKLLAVTSAICLITVFAFIFFRTVPVSRLWKGYQVVYVKTQTVTEPQLARILEENGCRNVVSKSSQRIPVISNFSPVQVQNSTSYLSRRDVFFHDETNTAFVFYVPEGQDAALSRALATINSLKNTQAGTDGSASFPWGSPIVCIVFAIVCLVFAKNKLTFAASAFFMVCFSFSRPLYTVSAAVCLSLYGFFMFQKIWGRRAFAAGLASPLFAICLLSPVLLLFLSAPLSALFYTLSLLAAFSAVLLVDVVKSMYAERYEHYRFNPVMIRSARFIPLVEKKEVKVILLLILSVIIMLLLSFAGSRLASVTVDTSRPALPSPVVGKTALPDLDDFMNWSWNTITFPYRRLTDDIPQVPVDGDSVSMPVYEETGGRIVQKEETAFVFNSGFRNKVFDTVRDLNYPALEKMMLRQGKDARYSYARGGTSSGERFGTILLFLFLLFPAGIILYFVVIKRGYGISF